MEEKIKELTLLLLYLNSWVEKEPYGEFHRAWKGYDFDILNALEESFMISSLCIMKMKIKGVSCTETRGSLKKIMTGVRNNLIVKT